MGGWGQDGEGPRLPGKVREGWGGGGLKGAEAWLSSDPSADMLDLGERCGAGGLGSGKKEGKETETEKQKIREAEA